MLKDQQLLKELNEVQLLFNSKATDLALKKIDKIIKKNDKQYLPYNYRGIIFLAIAKYDLALIDFRKSVSLHKEFAEGYCNIGNAYQALGNYQKSLEAYFYSQKLEKNNLQTQINMGILYFKMGEYKLAIDTYKKVLSNNKNIEYVYHLIADAYVQESKHDQSFASHEEALKINPSNYLNYFLMGRDYLWAGKKKLATEFIEKSIAMNPSHCPSYFALSKLRKISLDEEITNRIYILLNEESTTLVDKAYLNFSLAKIFSDKNDYDESFKYLKIGNQCMKEHTKFNFTDYEKEMHRSIDFYNTRLSKIKLSEKNTNDNICPIFILGMPRSGSSLVEQIICNASEVFGAGELDSIHHSLTKLLDDKKSDQIAIENTLYHLRKKYLDRLKNITDKSYVIDKLPFNFLWIGYIRILFPNAKIIHTYRNPVATCFSIYKTLFTEGSLEFSYDQDDIISFYKMYEHFMSFWNLHLKAEILNVNYDDLVLNSEFESKKIFDFIGVEYSKNYLNLENHSRSIMTASDLQVRNEIYQGSSDVWLKYKNYLKKFTIAFQN
jgi:tetratricopeptide (TPR) repeat protein